MGLALWSIMELQLKSSILTVANKIVWSK